MEKFVLINKYELLEQSEFDFIRISMDCVDRGSCGYENISEMIDANFDNQDFFCCGMEKGGRYLYGPEFCSEGHCCYDKTNKEIL